MSPFYYINAEIKPSTGDIQGWQRVLFTNHGKSEIRELYIFFGKRKSGNISPISPTQGEPIEKNPRSHIEVFINNNPLPLTWAKGPIGGKDCGVIHLSSPVLACSSIEIDIYFNNSFMPSPASPLVSLNGWYPRITAVEDGFSMTGDFLVSVSCPPEFYIFTSALPVDQEEMKRIYQQKFPPEKDISSIPPVGDGIDGEPSKKSFFYSSALSSFGIVLTPETNWVEGEAEMVPTRDGEHSNHIKTRERVWVKVFYPAHEREFAKFILSTAVDVIRFYRDYLGFYPYPQLIIVPGAQDPTGGCPLSTGVVAIHGFKKSDEESEAHWLWITAHEIAHQYFGELVQEKDSPGWLWLALGLYLDRKYLLYKGMQDEIHKKLMGYYLYSFNQGENTRLFGSQKSEGGSQKIAQEQQEMKEREEGKAQERERVKERGSPLPVPSSSPLPWSLPLSLPSSSPLSLSSSSLPLLSPVEPPMGFHYNTCVLHGKGFYIIYLLSFLLGDDVFKRILNRCLTQFRHKSMGFEDFRRICGEEAGPKAEAYLNIWD